MNAFTAAKHYVADLHWKVIPLLPRDKKPLTAHGLKDGTLSVVQVQDWWSKTPTANVGIVTGSASGFFALDIDGEEGRRSLATLERLNGAIQTRAAHTGSDGLHYLFQTFGVAIRNRTRIKPGIDVRGDGGYIVGPPSIHPSGKEYSWVDEAVEIAPAPAWLLNLLFDDSAEPTIEAPAHTGNKSRYAEKALDSETARVMQASEGTRNDTLNRAAFSLGQLVAANLLERPMVEASLLSAAQHAGLHESEALKTINSGMAGGMKKPRQIAPSANGHTRRATETDEDAEPANESPQQMKADLSYLVTYPLTDLGNAECLVQLHGDTLRYDHTAKRWRIWNGQRWKMDSTGESIRLMQITTRARRNAFNVAKDEDGWKYCLRSENQRNAENALKSASTHTDLSTEIEQYDRDPMLVCAGDVTIDLATCKPKESQREDYITRKLGTDYDEAATCPRWVQFMDELFPSLPEMVAYMRRAFGYCLTGNTREQVFFLCYGTGRNGKSTFLNILRKLAGEYADSTSFETFDAETTETRSDLAQLRACRVVTVIEADEGKRLAEARIKSITGGDEVRARELYAMPFSYYPHYKLWMAMNHLPGIRGTDNGIWRRIHLIEFNQDFRGREDKHLEAKLIAELPGILNWSIAGLQDWHVQGLNPPPQVMAATQAYRDSSDLMGQWIQDCCIVATGKAMKSASGYTSFAKWAKDAGITKPPTAMTWKKYMEEHNMKSKKTNTGRVFMGVGLLEEPEVML